MNRSVVIVDYGCGNIFNLKNALEVCGANVRISNDADEIKKAPRLILPGVGAFGHGITSLKENGLMESVVEFAHTQRPLFGICLGMQLLTSRSREHGEWEGLDLIPGEVVSLSELNSSFTWKVPQIGWSQVFANPENEASWQSNLLQGWKQGAYVYYVHSMFARVDTKYLLGVSRYGDKWISSIIGRDNIWGAQFHPERSGQAGLQLLKSFLEV